MSHYGLKDKQLWEDMDIQRIKTEEREICTKRIKNDVESRRERVAGMKRPTQNALTPTRHPSVPFHRAYPTCISISSSPPLLRILVAPVVRGAYSGAVVADVGVSLNGEGV